MNQWIDKYAKRPVSHTALSCFTTVLRFLAVAVGTALCVNAYADPIPTGFVRQLGKDKPRVYLIATGPEATAVANGFRDDILAFKENKHKPEEVLVLSPADAAQQVTNDPNFNSGTRVFFLETGEQTEPLSDALAGLCPLKQEDRRPHASLLKCECLNPKAGDLSFSIALEAPDQARLKRLLTILEGKTYPDHVAMHAGFTERYLTYKVAHFSAPEDRAAFEHWGEVQDPHIWLDTHWNPLEERDRITPEQLKEWYQVYFIDRSRKDNVIPASVAKLLEGQDIKATTVVAKQAALPDRQGAIVVFSAPNAAVLRARAKTYSTFGTIKDAQVVEELKDFRRIGRPLLLVNGAGPNAEEKESIRLQVARALREELKAPVDERGEILDLLQKEVTLEDLQGAGGTADLLRRKGKLRYVWLFTVLEYSGGTEFKSDVTKLKEDPYVTYNVAHHQDDPEPVEPVAGPFDGRGKQAEVKAKHPQWEIDHAAWLKRKSTFEDKEKANLTAQYSREVTRTTTGKARGVLRLIDLQEGDRPVELLWDLDCPGIEVEGPNSVKKDTVVVRLGVTPKALETPPNNDRCPRDLLKQAAVNAAHFGLVNLRENALLPDRSRLQDPSESPKHGGGDNNPAAPAKSTGPVVADVDTATVTITLGATPDIRVGDQALVILSGRDIKDPTTGEVIKTTILESVSLKVVKVDAKSADCVAASPADAAKLGSIKPGMAVKTSHQP